MKEEEWISTNDPLTPMDKDLVLKYESYIWVGRLWSAPPYLMDDEKTYLSFPVATHWRDGGKMNQYSFIYRPPNYSKPIAQEATIGVKSSNKSFILDDWHIVGGIKWSRTLYRIKHPLIYSRRGLRNLRNIIKHFFIRPKILGGIKND